MSRQYVADVPIDPPSTALSTITATTETVLVPPIFTQIPAMAPRGGKVYTLTVGGTCTTGAAGTLIITPRYGLVIGGVALGASPTQNYVPSITLAPFVFEYWLQFRTIGIAAGANSTATGHGVWASGGAGRVATGSGPPAGRWPRPRAPRRWSSVPQPACRSIPPSPPGCGLA